MLLKSSPTHHNPKLKERLWQKAVKHYCVKNTATVEKEHIDCWITEGTFVDAVQK